MRLVKRSREPLYTPPVIPRDRALLCLDCDGIYEAQGPQTCPGCGSHEALSLGRALDRQKPGGHA